MILRHWRLFGFVAVLALAACGSPTPSAVDTDGAYRLTFVLPQTTYRTTDAISGTATLELIDGKEATIGVAYDGALGFSFDEVGGTRHMGTIWLQSCRDVAIEAGTPITSGIEKGAAWSSGDPDAAFYQSFIADPEFHLPTGAWEVSGLASFLDGGCSVGPGGPVDRELTATIRVTITP